MVISRLIYQLNGKQYGFKKKKNLEVNYDNMGKIFDECQLRLENVVN